jgi:hypothetical protein
MTPTTEKNPIVSSIEENPINHYNECPICFDPFDFEAVKAGQKRKGRFFAWDCSHPCCMECFKELAKHNTFDKCSICKSSLQERMKYTNAFVTKKIGDERVLWVGQDLNHIHKDFDIQDLKDSNQALLIKEFVAKMHVVTKTKTGFREKINSLKTKWRNFNCEQSLFGKKK